MDQLGKKLYSIRESYWVFYNGIRTMRLMSRARRNNELSPQFIERIMLAVTEVNDCAICSYAHTKMALERGMSNDEIQKMLSGITDDVPAEELAGVMFAQHYADNRGKPSQKSWNRLVEVYGASKAKGILGAIRTIMIGNIFGIAFSSFFYRLRAKSDPRSSLRYELSFIFGSIFIVPVATVHAIFSALFKIPLI